MIVQSEQGFGLEPHAVSDVPATHVLCAQHWSTLPQPPSQSPVMLHEPLWQLSP
jgi:hypothetical protein